MILQLSNNSEHHYNRCVIIRKFNTVLRMPLRNWILLFQVLGLSLQARYLDRFRASEFRPERWLSASLREPEFDTDIQRVRDIAWAIRIVSRLTPWTNVCRHQAWQGAVLISRSGFAFDYFVGAKKSDHGVMEGHSWILSANRFVSGRCNVREYRVLNQYR